MSAALLAPFLYPYYLTQREQGLTRSLDEVALYSSTWRDYLSTAGRLHYGAWSHRFFEGTTSLFPGTAPRPCSPSSALVAQPRLARRPDPDDRRDWRRRRRALVRARAAGLRARSTSGCRCCRASAGAARFGFLALIAVAVLAGFGVAALRERCGQARRWWPVVAAVAASRRSTRRRCARRSPTGRSTASRASTRRSADRSVGAVAEFPFYPPAAIFRNAPYVLNSTAHWKPLVNGYSGFVPGELSRASRTRSGDFPDDRSRAELQRLGVTHVVVHLDAYGDGADAMASALRATRGWRWWRPEARSRSTGSSLLDDHRLRRSGLGRTGLGGAAWAVRRASAGCRTAGGSPRPCRGCAARSSASRGTGCRR